jgi:phosphoribosylanthranilate isomerase
MIVKICGITNRDDALAAVECGAAALGFNFYPASPRYIAPEAARLIAESLPKRIWKAGVFVNEPPERVLAIAAEAALDIVQLHGECAAPRGIRVWRGVRVAAEFDPATLDPLGAEAYLLDTPSDSQYGGTGKTFDWRRARGARAKVVVAGGLDETNVRRAIEEAQPWGVDACSRLELAPGLKDHAKMARFLKAALEMK